MSLRRFKQHKIRKTLSLDGSWDFITQEDLKGKTGLPKKYSRKIEVPGCWEQIPGLENYRGKAWLRTRFKSPGTKALRIVFGGVSHTGTVYVDKKISGTHYDAFTPWDVVVRGVKKGVHELVVEVDNSFGPHSALHRENDYYTYGGITRPVEAQWIPDLFIENIQATPAKSRGWNLEVKIRIRNLSDTSLAGKAIVSLGNRQMELSQVSLKPKSSHQITQILSGLKVAPWTPENPKLYDLRVILEKDGEAIDDLSDRVGFREFKVKGRKLMLNGRSIRLRGFNRHEDHPVYGNALPIQAMNKDLNIMQDLGSNFVRTSHYPNDMRFLDMCDERGIMVWEESHCRTVPFDEPNFDEQITQSTKEMVEWHANHPSIVMWGCLNECESNSSSGKRTHKKVLNLIREMDPSRPVTFASNKNETDLCLDLVDIVSWNKYDGWYSGGPNSIGPPIEELLRWLHSKKSGGADKPVILSEFGAGALRGYNPAHKPKWSESYQADVLDKSLEHYLNHPDIAGAAIWQFCDVRVTRRWWLQRPRTMNNKGVVDEFRKPKLSYKTVKKRFFEAKKRWGC